MLAARSGEKDIAALLLNHRAKIEASDKVYYYTSNKYRAITSDSMR